MMNLKHFPTPIKIFLCLAIALALGLLTSIAVLPVAYIYDFQIGTWETIHYTTISIYFIATIYWVFYRKPKR